VRYDRLQSPQPKPRKDCLMRILKKIGAVLLLGWLLVTGKKMGG
jgi:hypothetical protein